MLSQLIEEKAGYKVELTKGIGGGTSNIQPAMEKGEFDLYPEYTSSGWIMVLGHEAGEVSDEEMLSKLQEEYEKEFDMTWIGLYGFNNTYAVVTTKEAAETYQLRLVPIWQKCQISWYLAVTRIISNGQMDFRAFKNVWPEF